MAVWMERITFAGAARFRWVWTERQEKSKSSFFFATLYLLTAEVVSHRRRRRRCWRKTSIRQRATMSLQKGEKNVKMEENQNGNEKSCISHDKIIIISHRCRFAPTTTMMLGAAFFERISLWCVMRGQLRRVYVLTCNFSFLMRFLLRSNQIAIFLSFAQDMTLHLVVN